MTDLDAARNLLSHQGYTCVLCAGDRVATSQHRGVAPLLGFLDSGKDYTGYSAADKVVGKATALLYRLLGVKAVWAAVISESALRVLQAGGIEAHWDQLVPHIINRTGTGPCPMEAATAHTEDPLVALEAIRIALKNLQSA